jgi:hypothetical protein
VDAIWSLHIPRSATHIAGWSRTDPSRQAGLAAYDVVDLMNALLAQRLSAELAVGYNRYFGMICAIHAEFLSGTEKRPN